jgi:hypothetical protein
MIGTRKLISQYLYFDPCWIHRLPRKPNVPWEVNLLLVKTDKKGKVNGAPGPGEAGSIKISYTLMHIEGAPRFAAGDRGRNTDPYLEARLAHSENAQRFKTRVIKNAGGTEWKEQITICSADIWNDLIDVVILDSDELGESRKIAKTRFPLKAFPVGGALTPSTFSLDPVDRKAAAAGTLTLLGKISVVPAVDEESPAPHHLLRTRREHEFAKYQSYGHEISPNTPEDEDFHRHPPPRYRMLSQSASERGAESVSDTP